MSPRLIPLILMIIIVIPYSDISIGDALSPEDGSYVGEPRINVNTGRSTSALLGPGHMENMDHLENISVYGGNRLTFDRSELSTLSRVAASPDTNLRMDGGRNIQCQDNITFISFVLGSRYLGWYSFRLLRYDGQSNRFDHPFEVANFSGYQSASTRLFLHENRIHYVMALTSPDNADSRIFVKTVNLTSYYDLPDAETIRLDTEGYTTLSVDILAIRQNVVAVWSSVGSRPDQMCFFKNGSWETTRSLPVNGVGLWPISGNLDGKEALYIFYTTGDLRFLNMTRTYDQGNTWTAVEQVMNTPKGLKSISISEHQGFFHMGVLFQYVDEVGYIRYAPGNYMDRKIVRPENNPLDPMMEVVIASDEGMITIAYENGTGGISGVHSSDGGLSFSKPVTMASGGAHSPSMDPGKNFFTYMAGGFLIIDVFRPQLSGSLRSSVLSPPALGSWTQFGISSDGFDQDCSMEIRIMSAIDNRQLEPGSGLEDMLNYPPGEIDGLPYDHVLDLSGEWALGDDPEPAVYIEIFLSRSPSSVPSIYGMCLNYTIEYPYTDDFTVTYHIISSVNLKRVSDGLQLSDDVKVGKLILGPFQREVSWPDVLGIRMRSPGDNYQTRVELLTASMKPIPGFEMDRSDNARDVFSVNYIHWDGRSLTHLPVTIDEIYFRIEIRSFTMGMYPRISYLVMENSESPVITSSAADDSELPRGEETILRFDLDDREDDPNLLDIKVKYRPEGTSEWMTDALSDTVFENGEHTVRFHTNGSMRSGIYEFSAAVVDSTNTGSDEVLLPIRIELINNLPDPPLFYVAPDSPRDGDELVVHLYQEGKDRETEADDLRYICRFAKGGHVFHEIENFTEQEISFGRGIVKKGETWNIAVSTWDGEDEGPALVKDVDILNSPPEIVLPDGFSVEMQEDATSGPLPYEEWFSDRDGDTLFFEFNITEGLSWVTEGGTLTIVPDANMNGNGTLIVSAFDGEVRTVENIPVSVKPVNDPPLIGELPDMEVFQDEKLFIDINASDRADGDDLSITCDIQDVVPGLIEGTNYHILRDGAIILIANNDMVGTFNVTYGISDGQVNVNRSFNLSIINVNDPPSRPSITTEPDSRTLVNTSLVILEARSIDPDTPWGDELTYSWRSDIQGDLGTGSRIEVDLIPGEHRLEVEVRDLEGEINVSTLNLTVIGKIPDHQGSIRTVNMIIIAGLISLITGVVVGFLIVKRYLRNRPGEEAERENGGVGEEDQREEGSEKEGGGEEKGKPEIGTEKDERGGDGG